MNLLIDLVPKTVCISGKDVDIRSNFRTSILFELMMNDAVLSDEEKLFQTLQLYYPVVPENLEEALNKALWFYRGGMDEERKGVGGKKASQIYSFEYDAEYIYAAFMDQYGVNLQSIDYLHWWEFKAMFKGLKEDNEIVKIMGYRAVDITSEMNKEQQKFYRKMKEAYKIPLAKTERDKLSAVENALLNGGNLSNVL